MTEKKIEVSKEFLIKYDQEMAKNMPIFWSAHEEIVQTLKELRDDQIDTLINQLRIYKKRRAGEYFQEKMNEEVM